jgi:hypothetical protein
VIQNEEKVLQSRSLFRDFVGLPAVVEFVVVGSGTGMPVVIPTTTKSTAPKRLRDSRDSDPDCSAFSMSRVFASKFLRGWQYDNLLLACTAALSRTASDALENQCTYLRGC